jgi:hypothetical protein
MLPSEEPIMQDEALTTARNRLDGGRMFDAQPKVQPF